MSEVEKEEAKTEEISFVLPSDIEDCIEIINLNLAVLHEAIDAVKSKSEVRIGGMFADIQRIANGPGAATVKLGKIKAILSSPLSLEAAGLEGLAGDLLEPVTKIEEQVGEIEAHIENAADDDAIAQAIEDINERLPELERVQETAIDYIDSTERNLACEEFDFETFKRAVQRANR